MSILAHSLDSYRTKDVILDENVTFESLLLNKSVLQGLAKSGFKKPSPIQAKAVPVGRCGFDLIIRSKSGTGKTLVYALIALEIVEISKTETQALILVPTREIAVQIEEVLLSIGKYIKGLQVKCFIGGFPLHVDREKCQICHIAIGTPGRVKHLINEGILKTDLVRLLVLDEVDKLMEYSFLNYINEIYNNLSRRTQIITTSATYTNELNRLLQKYMLSPTYIGIEDTTPFLWGLKQFVHVVKQHSNVVQQMKVKTEEVLKIFSNISFTQCVIFTNYKIRAESISNTLNQKGWRSIYLSAARAQPERLTAIKDLKNFSCKIMLSTDLTARGIDVANIDLVINYDVPIDATTYLHRMGRAGRYGSAGICINLVSEGAELQQIRGILYKIGGSSMSIPELPNFNDSLMDSVKVNVLSKNYFCGIPNKILNNSNLNNKREFLDLKDMENRLEEQNKHHKAKQHQPYLTANSTEKYDSIENNINEILSNTKKESELIRKQFCDKDTYTVLKSLASGGYKMGSDVSGHNTLPYTELQQLILFAKYKPLEMSYNERKPVKFESKYSSRNVQEFNTKEILYHKNKALLCVLTIISIKVYNDTVKKNTVEYIRAYLNILKVREGKEIQDILCSICQNEIDILKNIDQRKLHKEANLLSNEYLESVFKKGYDSVTKSSSSHWRSYFSNSQVKLQKVPSKEQTVDNTDDYFMKEENTSIDNYMSSKEDPVYRLENMKSIPVGNSEDVQILNTKFTCWEDFYKYFSNYSEYLWSNGLSFENVKDFDNWFYYKWQGYIFAVRNYIQQNIYLQEMNNYEELNKNVS